MDDDNTLGAQIRLFFRHLLGSRLVDHIETELLRLRNDYEARLLDRERTICDLREQVTALSGKVDRYELVLLPLASPMGDFFRPKPKRVAFEETSDKSAPTSWDEVQADFYAQQAAEDEKEKRNGHDQRGEAQILEVSGESR